jgi:hypothetical protein
MTLYLHKREEMEGYVHKYKQVDNNTIFDDLARVVMRYVNEGKPANLN